MLNKLIGKIGDEINLNTPGVYTFLNPYSYLMLRNSHVEINDFEAIFIDGIFLVKIVKLFLRKDIRRMSFDNTSLSPKVMQYINENKKSLYVVGSSEKNIIEFVRLLKDEYPTINIVGYRNGFFESDSQRDEFIYKLVSENPDFVLCGMGAPLQDQFLTKLKKSNWKGIGFSCGGFIHQTAGRGQKYYPDFFDKNNLRWVYRIIDEPKLLKRYFVDYLHFVYVFFFDFISYKIRNEK